MRKSLLKGLVIFSTLTLSSMPLFALEDKNVNNESIIIAEDYLKDEEFIKKLEKDFR